jgi:hypothetical protein
MIEMNGVEPIYNQKASTDICPAIREIETQLNCSRTVPVV